MAWSEVHDDLLQKVNREMEDYQTRMLSRTSIEVYNQAEEIAAMGFCHNQLMEYLHDSQAVDLSRFWSRRNLWSPSLTIG